jgi:hypothetical protein
MITPTCGPARHEPEGHAEDVQGADEGVEGQHQARYPGIDSC